jgi:hypothetical protein
MGRNNACTDFRFRTVERSQNVSAPEKINDGRHYGVHTCNHLLFSVRNDQKYCRSKSDSRN